MLPLSMPKTKTERPGRFVTKPMRRLIRRFGYLPSFAKIAREAHLLRPEVSYILQCRRATKRVRRAVAKWAGMRQSELFAGCDSKKGVAA